jgi:hypothetical protein
LVTDKNETVVALMVSVLNKGASSTITGYQVHYHSLAVDDDFSPVQLVRPLVSQFEGVNYILSNGDNLLVKMADSEIPRGSVRSGRLFIVSIGLKGDQFHRFGGSHSDEKVALGHTNVPAGRTGGPPPHSKPDKFRPNINPSNYPPAHPTGEAILKYDARGGYRGSIPWPGRGRSQRTRDPSGR